MSAAKFLSALAALDEPGLNLAATGRLAVAALSAATHPAGTLSPEQHLSALVQLQPAHSDDGLLQEQWPDRAAEQGSLQWVHTAAALTLLLQLSSAAEPQRTAAAQAAAPAVLAQLLLPLLAGTGSTTGGGPAPERQQQLLQAAADVVASCHSWVLGLELVQAAVPLQAQEAQAQQHPHEASQPQPQAQPQAHARGQQAGADFPLTLVAGKRVLSGAAAAAALRQLPPGLRLLLASAVILKALQNPQQASDQPLEQDGRLSVLQYAAEVALPAALQLLLRQEPEARQRAQCSTRGAKGRQPTGAAPAPVQVAAQQLVPAALQAAAQVQQQAAALQQLWATIKKLLGGAAHRRELGLDLLVRFAGPLLQEAQEGPQKGTQGELLLLQWGGLRADPDFWQLLRSCLCDNHLSNRKRAAHVLQLAVAQDPDGQLAPAWRSFVKVLDCLEELAPHLVQDGWSEMDRLHPPAAGAGEPCPLPTAPTQGADTGPFSWPWLEVLWTRGLRHEHQQVQRHVLSSFLARQWAPTQPAQGEGSPNLASFPQAFALHVLLPAAGQAHQWRGEGAGDLQRQLATWVGQYVAAQGPPEERRQLLLALLSQLESSGSSGQEQRPLAQTLAGALVAAAESAGLAGAEVPPPLPAGTAAVYGSSPGTASLRDWQLLFLQRLHQATTSLSAHWGSGGASGSYARSMCGSLLQAAALAVPLGAAWGGSAEPQLLSAAAAWLQLLPLALLLPGGELHEPAAAWVQAADSQHMLAVLAGCIQNYMAPPPAASGLEDRDRATPASLTADWGQQQPQAAGLARLALLLASSGSSGSSGMDGSAACQAGGLPAGSAADLEAAFASWTGTLEVLYRRPYLPPGTAICCLLLLNELLAVCLPAGGAGHLAGDELLPGQRQLRALVDWLVAALAGAGADELASYASLAAGAGLWGQQQQPDHSALAARRAQLALSCVCGTLRLLAWHQQKQQQQGSCQVASPAGERLIGSCLEVLQSFHAANSQAGGVEQLQGQGQLSAASWQRAAAQLLPVADCCLALAAAAEAGWLQGRALEGAVAEAASASLGAVLQLQVLAAQDAAAQRPGKAGQVASGSSSASGSNNSGSPAALAAYCHRLCWKAADALLQLLGWLHNGGHKVQQHVQAWQQQHAGHAPHAMPLDSQRWAGQQAAALAAALASLQRSSAVPALASDARGLLLQLRCCRLTLQAALAQPRVGQLVAAQRQSAGASGAGASAAVASHPNTLLAAWVCEVTWGAYEAAAVATKRRRAGLTAAVVTTCLHLGFFEPSSCSAALHAPGSPLHQVLERLLTLGAKSWRIMSIVSLQLCGLLSWHPELVPQYSGSLQQLLLWGSSDDPGQSGVGDPVDADSAAELAALIAPADPEVAAAFAGSELAPRVAALCLLRSWVETAQQVGQQTEAGGGAALAGSGGAAAAAAGEAGQLMWRQLLSLLGADSELGAARYTPLGHVHRKKVRLWQALCILSPLVPAEQAEQDLDHLLAALATPELANVRQYIDTSALVLLRRRPALLCRRVLPLLRDCSSSSSHALSSLIILAAREAVRRLRPAAAAGAPAGPAAGAVAGRAGQMAGSARPQDGGEVAAGGAELESGSQQLLDEVLGAVTPWALSHVHALRTFAQLVLWRLFELFPSLPATDPSAAAMLRFFTENDDVARLRRGLSHAFYFDVFDLDQAVAPAGILCMGTSVLRADASFEGASQPLLEAVQAFLAAERQHLRQELHESKAAATTAELAPPGQLRSDQLAAAGAGRSGSNWQKKGGGAAAGPGAPLAAGPSPAGAAAAGPWADALGSAALLGRGLGLDGTEADVAAAAEAAAATGGGGRQQLVVVASLLTKAPNLAGLARTCEVFRASCLVLGDLSVTRQKEFSSIAVTAHQWMPLVEVPEAALSSWLQLQAARGWTLVGLEQTAESVQLQEFAFPPRTVLVLGREKEGIPPPILGLLHHTVEIPQLSPLIRSLNVHVSGAISVWEYTRQRALAAAAADAGGAGPPAAAAGAAGGTGAAGQA